MSVGPRDERDAQQQKQQLAARLLLGIESILKKKIRGPHILCEDFHEEYSTIQLTTLSEKSDSDTESRLDIAERILKPKTLADVANQRECTPYAAV